MSNPVKDWYFKYMIAKCHKRYDEELRRFSDPYGMWIQANEDPSQTARANHQDPRRFRVFILEDFIKIMREPEEINEGWLAIKINPGWISEPSEKWSDFFSEDGPRTPTALIFGDEDTQDIESKRRSGAWFKPDDSPETLLSFFYYGSLVLLRGSLVKESLSTYAPCYDKKELETLKNADPVKADRLILYDFILHYTEEAYAKGYKVRRIPEVLFHADGVGVFLEDPEGDEYVNPDAYWGYEPEYNACKIAAIRRRGMGAYIRGIPRGNKIYCVPVYELPEDKPEISVIIPSKDHPDLVIKRLDELRNRMNYDNMEIIVVDNGSNDENRQILCEAQAEYRFIYMHEEAEFNFAAMCNKGAEKSKGEYLLFLNDDVEITQPDFISTLVGQAMAPGIGAVGAKLLYPDRRIQHVGVTEMAVGPAHKLVGAPDDDKDYYYGKNVLNHNVIAVTAACLMVNAEVFFGAGGFYEELKISYNDVDFCFMLHESGYRNVVRNDAVAIHHESISRGDDRKDTLKWKRLLRESAILKERHPHTIDNDPFYNPNLAGYKPRYLCSYEYPYEQRFNTLLPEALEDDIKSEWYNNCLTITLEHCGLQRKLSEDEEDIYLIEGWAYVLGMDSSRYERSLILTFNDEEILTVPIYTRNRPEVVDILPDESHVGLTGFVVRIKRNDLKRGEYRVGLLYKDQCSRQRLYKECEKVLYVD